MSRRSPARRQHAEKVQAYSTAGICYEARAQAPKSPFSIGMLFSIVSEFAWFCSTWYVPESEGKVI